MVQWWVLMAGDCVVPWQAREFADDPQKAVEDAAEGVQQGVEELAARVDEGGLERNLDGAARQVEGLVGAAQERLEGLMEGAPQEAKDVMQSVRRPPRHPPPYRELPLRCVGCSTVLTCIALRCCRGAPCISCHSAAIRVPQQVLPKTCIGGDSSSAHCRWRTRLRTRSSGRRRRRTASARTWRPRAPPRRSLARR